MSIGDQSFSFEFLFSLPCMLIVALELAAGDLKVAKCNGYFLFGLILWLAINVVSAMFHPSEDGLMSAFRMMLKALFGYTVFLVLMNNGRFGVAIKYYMIGCAVAGLFSIAFFLQGGSFEDLRQTNFAGLDASATDVDLFGGIARAGASNLLPFWICIILYFNTRNLSTRSILLFLMPYFALLSTLALRRQVLIEGMVGLLILIAVSPKRRRPVMLLIGAASACVIAGIVLQSDRWMDRLNLETREQFGTLTDPRLVLLINTPAELLEKPLLGHGPGSYRQVMAKCFPNSARVQQKGIAAHNGFSCVAVEAGMIGLLGFVVMVAALGWKVCLIRSRNTPASGLLRLSAIFIFFQVISLLSFGQGITNNSTWYFIGLLLYFDRRLLREDKKSLISP